MRNNKGITLVSLVVTIIILIILAGVSINLTLGENGIITMAKKSRENMELAKVDEERQLNELYEQIVTEGGSSGNASDDAIIRLAEFKREIASAITDMGIETLETADATTMSSNIRNISTNKDASSISYDNTNSSLISTNVQGAVDELDSEIDEINSTLSNGKLSKQNTLLGSFSGNKQHVLTDSLNNYNYLMFIWLSPLGYVVSGEIPIEIFKTTMISVDTRFAAAGADNALNGIYYVNDTTVGWTSGDTVKIYGINYSK